MKANMRNVGLEKMLSPLDLCVDSLRIDVPETVYDHGSQMSSFVGDAFAASMLTWNATRTYDWNGRPHDSDNDR
jgi:hypothetical protein